MTTDIATMYAIAGVMLFAIGLHALIAYAHLLRKIIGINVMGSGVFMIVVASAQRSPIADPVPHAMVLTGIVVAISATALALTLAIRVYEAAERESTEETEAEA